MRVLLILLCLLPQLAAARVFMCVDPATGKTTLTDRGCDPVATREEMRVNPTNGEAKPNGGSAPAREAWVSDRESRRTARDYVVEQRRLREDGPGDAAAAIDREQG